MGSTCNSSLYPSNPSTERLRAYGPALVGTKCFKNRLSFSTSYVLTTIVIIYILNIIDSLGNYIFINIYYSPILGISRSKIAIR